MSKYSYNGVEFNRKEDVTIFVRKILYKYEDYEFINQKDFEFLYDLLKKGHYNSDNKIGCGVAGIFIKNNNYGNRCFFLKRLDGSEEHYSFVKCIHPKHPLQDIKNACRTAIREDIIEFKTNFFHKNTDSDDSVICPFTGTKVYEETCHVDHVPPQTFNKIFSEWVHKISIDPKSIKIINNGKDEMIKDFEDLKIKNSFIDFHKKMMKLRITSQLGNLSGSKIENSKIQKK